jgi:hypothetical protein
LVAGDKLNKYGDFTIVNKLAKDYNYTHEDAFNLSWRVAFTILALDKEQLYIETRAAEMAREKNK